jgi:hypothetical protein
MVPLSVCHYRWCKGDLLEGLRVRPGTALHTAACKVAVLAHSRGPAGATCCTQLSALVSNALQLLSSFNMVSAPSLHAVTPMHPP